LRRACTNPQVNATELFRRMCFNALISNIDDHPRNHALIAKDKEWKLSPAYGLTPAVPVSISRRDLAMKCGDAGRFANADNLLSQSATGVAPVHCDTIAGAFAYEGFRHGG